MKNEAIGIVWYGTMTFLMFFWMIFDAFELYTPALACGILLLGMLMFMLFVVVKSYKEKKDGKRRN